MKFKVLGVLVLSTMLTACCSETPEPQVVCTQPGSIKDFCDNVGDRVYFEFDRSDLMPCGQETLRRQAEWLARYGTYNITVVGNCDERGTSQYNMALGERRANAACDALVKAGVPRARITVCSMGKEKPSVAGSNEAAWAENRNAITVLCSGGTGAAMAMPGAPMPSAESPAASEEVPS